MNLKKEAVFVKQYNQKICFFINRCICYYKYFVFNMKENEKKEKQSILSRHILKVFFIPKVNFYLLLGANSQKACYILEVICQRPKAKLLGEGTNNALRKAYSYVFQVSIFIYTF